MMKRTIIIGYKEFVHEIGIFKLDINRRIPDCQLITGNITHN
jgi:hypothetical protein